MSKKKNKRPAPRRNPSTNEPKVVRTSSGTQKRPTSSKSRRAKHEYSKSDLIFGRQNYILMIAGLVLVVIGMVLMSGGSMPDPNTWDESRIYSPLRITVAPIFILAGLALEIVAIFRKNKEEEVATVEE